MAKICLIQMDDRISLDYLLLTQWVNYDYIFIDTSEIYKNIDPKLRKITVINNFLNTNKNYDIIIFINNNPKFITHIHPFYDQPSISHYVFNNKDKFLIFDIEIFNTPIGSVIRHNWHKNKLLEIIIMILKKI